MPATPLAWAMWVLLAVTCGAIVRTHHQRFVAVQTEPAVDLQSPVPTQVGDGADGPGIA